MDTKLKNSRKIRIFLGTAAVLAAAVVSLLFFPVIGRNAKDKLEERKPEEGIDIEFMLELVRGSYVLYYETVPYEGADADEVHMVRYGIENWAAEFELYRDRVDYYAVSGEEDTTNTFRKLGGLLDDTEYEPGLLTDLKSCYESYFVFRYDEAGEMSVEQVYSVSGQEDQIVKAALQALRGTNFSAAVMEESDERTGKDRLGPKNFQVVYGISDNADMMTYDYAMGQYYDRVISYYDSGSGLLYLGMLAALTLVMILMSSNRIFRGTIEFRRRGIGYLMEAAIVGVIFNCSIAWQFAELNVQYVNLNGDGDLIRILKGGDLEQIVSVLEMGAALALIYGIWYVSLMYLRPVFSLGPKEYIRQYSLVYLLLSRGLSLVRRRWHAFQDEVTHIDFSRRTVSVIRKAVIVNFLVLAVISFFWFFGIFVLAAYSVALFMLLKRQYDRVERDYQSLMRATARIAQGELSYEDTSDWGIFEPFKRELDKIRKGFSRAVEDEVKSQRMKTELITNVSHDLKTPLTAITTYVELLKEPNITREQQAAYVEILEKKAQRLKVLVEDLFEVSKASSNTIRLELMEVDVVNLLKQVWAEHEASFREQELEVKWALPEGKVIRRLDNQKTYRIFENLFGNIEKYAMRGSRVYVEVTRTGTDLAANGADQAVEIVIKNMSAEEISVSGEEITQRFVRGDSARSTEGSGLGLAIAKSFTEAQMGEFEVTVDGDLFKVRIRWK